MLARTKSATSSRELFVSAGLDPSQAAGAPRVAAAVLGESYLLAVPRGEMPGNALLRRDGPRWVISVKDGLNARQLNHAIAHELGEWFFALQGVCGAGCRGVVRARRGGDFVCRGWRS